MSVAMKNKGIPVNCAWFHPRHLKGGPGCLATDGWAKSKVAALRVAGTPRVPGGKKTWGGQMWTIGKRQPACLLGTCPIEPTGKGSGLRWEKDVSGGCITGRQPAGSEFIFLVKGNTGGKILVVGRHPKNPCKHPWKKEPLLKLARFRKHKTVQLWKAFLMSAVTPSPTEVWNHQKL